MQDALAEIPFAGQPVDRGQVRRAFLILFRIRLLYVACAGAWVVQTLAPVSKHLQPADFWVAALSGVVAALTVICAMAIKRSPILASVQLALLSTLYVPLLQSYGILDWLPIALVAGSWAAVVPLFLVQRILADDPRAMDMLDRFARLTRRSIARRSEKLLSAALIVAAVVVFWRKADDYQLQQIPPALQVVLDGFVAAWNGEGDAELRRIVSASSHDDSWDSLEKELRERGWRERRPELTVPSTVRSYGTNATVQFHLPSSTLKTHWIRNGDDWTIEFLYVSNK